MSSVSTEWILNLTDKVTGPVKKMMSSIKSATSSVSDMGKEYKFTKEEAKDALVEAKKYYKQVDEKVKLHERNVKDLRKAFTDAAPGLQKVAALDELKKAKVNLDQYRKALVGAEKDMYNLNKEIREISKTEKNWTAVAVQVNQVSEIISKATRSLTFAVDVKRLRTDVQRMTDLTGKALDDFVAKSREIATVYDANANEVAKTANTMARQLGGSFDENLALLESGYKRGANIHGNYLSLMQQYAPAMQEMGVSTEETIAFIAKAGKEGVMPDKFIQGIQKAGVSLRKLEKREADALANIGVSIEDLQGKTAIEAVQFVANAMEGMSEQAKQTVITKVFKRAGEDSGAEFIMGLASGLPDLFDLPEVEETASGFRAFFSNISSWAGNAFGEVAIYSQQFAPVIQLIAGAIPVITALASSTKLATAAQWALNLALNANPIGIIIIAVAALIGLIVLVAKKWDSWSAALTIFMGPLGIIVSMVMSLVSHWDSIKEAFQDGGILAGIKRIGIVLLDAILKPVQQLLGWLAKIPGLGGLASKGADAIAGIRKKLELEEPKKKEKKEKEDLGVNAFLTKDANLLSYDDPEEKGKKSGKKGDGLNVGSGAGGVKTITMTLNVENHFSVDKNTNVRNIADEIVGMVNDRLRDSLVTIG